VVSAGWGCRWGGGGVTSVGLPVPCARASGGRVHDRVPACLCRVPRCRRGDCDVPAAVSVGVVEQRKPEPARLHNQIVIS
jgi:hypothetical protein